VIVDDLRSHEVDGDIERSARVRWRGGEHRLTIQVPAEFAISAEDASPFLAASLMSAMRRAEELHVDGVVSAKLLRRLEHIQGAYMMWDPTLTPCHVRVAATADTRSGATAIGAFFARGVDSMFTAIGGGNPDRPPLEYLIFSPSLDLVFDADVRRQELALAREAAAAIGLSLIRVETNVRAMTDLCVDWNDASAGGLAIMALSLGGGLEQVVVPSTHFHGSLKPHGTHPLLDPLYSTESVEVVHDSITYSRFGKVAYLVAQRPDLLPYLKVCWAENRPDNCGRCAKCLLTMAYLEACGALGAATSFPATLDLDLLSSVTHRPVWRMDAVECCRALDPTTQAPLRAAMLEMLRRSAVPTPRERAGAALAALRGEREHRDPRWSMLSSATLNTFNRQRAVVWEGRPWPPIERRVDPLSIGGSVSVGPIERVGQQASDNGHLVGLVRVLDTPGGRHVYGAGEIPPPLRPPGREERDRRVLVGELGSLHRDAGGDRMPLWLTSDGRAATSPVLAAPRRPGPLRAARWIAAPVTWPGRTSPRALGVAILRRLAVLPAAYIRPRAPAACGSDPAGYMERAPGSGLVALYSATHPVTGDQLLTNDPREASDLGYDDALLLGHLVGEAPVTGALGTIRPRIEWASHFGTGRNFPHGGDQPG
jgi:hypothetical protein